MIFCVQDDVELWLQRVCNQVEINNAELEYQSASDLNQELNLSHSPRHYLAARRKENEQSRSIAWESPIRKGSELLGNLRVRVDQAQPLQQNFLDVCQLAQTLSQMAADYTELKISLQAIQKEKNPDQNLDLKVLVEQALNSSIKMTGYRGAAFFLLDETGTKLQLKHYCHQKLEKLPRAKRDLDQAEFDREAITKGVSACRGKSESVQNYLPEDVSTGICFKVATSSGAIGTVWFFDRRVRVLNDRDYHVLQSIAAQLGTILERAVSLRQNENHRRMKTELRLAAATQPAKSLEYVSPENEVECFGCCLSQYDVGGDLCEIIPLSDKHLFVVVGDASGNSLPAAMVMTAVRGAVYALIAEITNPNEANQTKPPAINPANFMSILNRMLVTLTDAYQFMSCICGLFDLEKMTFSFCNAGHPPPVHLTSTGVEYLPSHGLLLGIEKSSQYDQATISISAEDVLVLYTDGISEAMSQSSRKLFRQDGIAEATQNSRDKCAKEIFNSIWDNMLKHSAGNPDSDDATALVIKFPSPSKSC